MNDVEFSKQLRWEIFKMSMDKAQESFSVIWKLPDGSDHVGASIHPNMNELVDFSRRAVREKIGYGAIALGFMVVNCITNKVVYDSGTTR